MKDYDIMFKDNMLVYSAEDAVNPTVLKVTIPEIFLDKPTGKVVEKRLPKGNVGIFVNEYPPALMGSVVSKNYITLPVIGTFRGNTTTQYGENITMSSGIGEIHVGDRLIASFIGNSPNNGVIIARC